MFHHVLIATEATDAMQRPVFVPPTADDDMTPANDKFRVYASPIPLGGAFCFVSREGERLCSLGLDHPHPEPSDG